MLWFKKHHSTQVLEIKLKKSSKDSKDNTTIRHVIVFKSYFSILWSSFTWSVINKAARHRIHDYAVTEMLRAQIQFLTSFRSHTKDEVRHHSVLGLPSTVVLDWIEDHRVTEPMMQNIDDVGIKPLASSSRSVSRSGILFYLYYF